MERYNKDRYYHGGLGAVENRRDFDRNTRDGDFGREYEDRYRGGRFNHYRNEDDNPRSYRDRDYDMEDQYYSQVRGERHTLDDIRQGYGFPSFEGSSGHQDVGRRMARERNAQRQQGYGSGRMGGYSGSGFGGANYSSHGSYGGSRAYGSMSGGGGNADDYVSSSGYGGDRSMNRGSSFGHESYGRSGGNYGGYGSREGDAYRAGRSVHDQGYSQETDPYERRGNTRRHQNW